jgi:outer membrane protein assembly factor BamB
MRAARVRAVLTALAVAACTGGAAGAQQRVDHPTWTATIDSRTTPQWLSESAGAVYGTRGGKVVALDLHTGRTRWTSSVAAVGRSASGGGFVVSPTREGVTFIDARDGRVRNAVRLRPIAMNVPAGPAGVASSSTGFVAVEHSATGVTVHGYTFAGTNRWTKHYRFDASIDRIEWLGGDAVGLRHGDELLVLDGRDGRAVAQTDGLDTLIGADGRYLWFNVVNGGIKGLDLTTNRTVVLHGSVVHGAARVEHGIAVAVVDGRLQRLDLRRDGHSGPLAIHGRWVGGPAAGRIFVERDNGMFVRALDDRAPERRVATYHEESRIVAADGRIAMIGMKDGRIYVVDLTRAQQLAVIDTPCRAYEGFAASDETTLVHCDAEADVSTLVAFPRYAVTGKD